MEDVGNVGSLALGALVGGAAALVFGVFLSYIGVAIGAAIGVKIVSSANMRRSLIIGLSAAIISAILIIFTMQTASPTILAANQPKTLQLASSEWNAQLDTAVPALSSMLFASLLIFYLIAGIVGAVVSKLVWVGQVDSEFYPKEEAKIDWYSGKKGDDAPPRY